MQPQLSIASVPASRPIKGKARRHGSRDDDDPPSPFVLLYVEFFRKIVQDVNERGFVSEEHFEHTFYGLCFFFRADLSVVSEELGGLRFPHELARILEEGLTAFANPDQYVLFYEAALTALTKKGFLMAGKRFDPFTGRTMS